MTHVLVVFPTVTFKGRCCLEPFVHALLVLKAEERTDIYYLCMKQYSLLRWYFATATAVRYSGSSVSIGSACVDVTQ